LSTDSKMEEYARDCIRLAGITSDPVIREQMLKMARRWKEAAPGSKQQQGVEQINGQGLAIP
jgi:hypothetical protein